ncbi:MAG: glycosyltransferase [Bacteroidia bacterium]|nr:glycosyltransferase [Bacteroidia bacterium]
MKKVLVAPLNWGLGHATRCMPVIETLQHKGAKVYVASSGQALQWLKQACNDVTFINLPDYNIAYSKNNQAIAVLKTWFKINKSIANEHKLLLQLQQQYHFDIVISDNRYGMWHADVLSIFICHQIQIPVYGFFSWLRKPLLNYHYKKIKKFNRCWIPDAETENNLSGIMSHGFKQLLPTNYIGLLSRFVLNDTRLQPIHKTLLTLGPFQIIVVLSGPEPQRTMLQQIVSKQLIDSGIKTLVVQGLPNAEQIVTVDNITYVSYLNTATLKYWLQHIPVIICRSGYSTLMDLSALNLKAIVIPTPGQYEQMYLAQYHHQAGNVWAVNQNRFNLNEAINGYHKTKGFQVSLPLDYMQFIDEII